MRTVTGSESAATLGISVARFRRAVFVADAFVTGIMVAYSGVIGFIGLMIPHIVRPLVGVMRRARCLCPCSQPRSFSSGPISPRTLMQPEDIRIGVITGLIGGAVFIWLLRHRSRRM